MSTTPTDDMLYGLDKGDNYYDAASSPSTDLGASASGAGTPLDETPEERERRMTELKEELEKVESEINMLRQVLGSKVRHASELKRRMGITPFQEFKQDLQSGIQQIKSSDPYQKTNDTLHQFNEKISQTQAYQKTSAVVKTATEKTSSAISTVGQVVAKKMGDIKNSQTFKSFDEKMHNTYANVKSSRSIEGLKERLARVTGSRSSSEIDDAFRDAHSADENLITTPESADDAANINLPEDKLPL
ncbi:tumor protein D54-like isoform X1 [Physella acuta]|uniref:tumor protein D54-like isoform X1 n=1 Tax=Physella acuta TaxID=109671 RepID=UPI0027DC12C5|nr:tumor protein D54-like isoform X1 [Physella acuta]